MLYKIAYDFITHKRNHAQRFAIRIGRGTRGKRGKSIAIHYRKALSVS